MLVVLLAALILWVIFNAIGRVRKFDNGSKLMLPDLHRPLPVTGFQQKVTIDFEKGVLELWREAAAQEFRKKIHLPLTQIDRLVVVPIRLSLGGFLPLFYTAYDIELYRGVERVVLYNFSRHIKNRLVMLVKEWSRCVAIEQDPRWGVVFSPWFRMIRDQDDVVLDNNPQDMARFSTSVFKISAFLIISIFIVTLFLRVIFGR